MGLIDKLFGKKEMVNQQPVYQEKKANFKSIVQIENTVKAVNEMDIPEFQGDYAKTIFLNALSKPTPIKNNSEYVKYFLYECGIRDAQKYHRQMIEEGYLEASTIEAMIADLKVDVLKEILRKLECSVSGKKADLVKRILDTNNTDLIKEYCNNHTYSISAKGSQFLNRYDDYVKLHKNKNWMISWREYDSCKQIGYGFYDTVWGILNKRVIQESTMGLMRNDYYFMYEVLCQENKEKQAMEMLLRVLYVDLSGSEGVQFWDLYRTGAYGKLEILDTYDIAIMLAPGIVALIEKHKDVYDDSIIDKIYEWNLPFCCCDKQLFKKIVSSIMDGTYDEEAVNKKLKAVYGKSLKEQLNIE